MYEIHAQVQRNVRVIQRTKYTRNWEQKCRKREEVKNWKLVNTDPSSDPCAQDGSEPSSVLLAESIRGQDDPTSDPL